MIPYEIISSPEHIHARESQGFAFSIAHKYLAVGEHVKKVENVWKKRNENSL